jgi:putative ABC transport system permease protein
MLQDLRFGMRMLMKQFGFAAIAVITLALGIGATSAVFSLIQGVLLTPPPYREPDRLVLIPAVRTDHRPLAHSPGWSAAQWMDWQREAKSIEAIAAYGWTFSFLVGSEGSESMEGMWVTSDYFRALGMQPVLGRTFTELEAGSKADPVIVIGYELWQRKFNGDPNVLGKTIHMGRWPTPPKIIGVMPASARFLPSPGASQEPNYDLNATVDFWTPAMPAPDRMKTRNWDLVARLKNGATLAQSQSELSALAAREAQSDRDFDGFAPSLEPLMDELNREGRGILFPLLGAAGLVLLIACGNVAALLLVRGLQRQQEYAVRSALGVGRWGLVRQVSAEGLLLALFGGTLGVAFAFGIVRIFKLIGGHAIPRLDAVATGWPVLAWGLGAAIVAGLVAGVFPAFRASRLDSNEVLKSAGTKSSAGRGERRLLRGVAIFQTALTMALLIGTGLLIRTMMNISKVQSGYGTTHILTATVTAIEGDWMKFHTIALERVAAIPGVQKAAFAWGVPLTGNSWPGQVEIEGQPIPTNSSDRIPIPLRSVTPGYFDLIGQSIAAGRDFATGDTRGTPDVTVVNQAFVDRYFQRASPLGKKIWGNGRQRPAITIIGVVTNARTDDLTKAPEPEIYMTLWQARAFSKDLVVRTAADPRTVMAAVQRELRLVDPTVAVENVKTMDQIRRESLASRTFAMQLLMGFSLAGSVLTLVGIFGVLALSVASRRREIAIRAAIGADRNDIRQLILAEGFRLIAGGVVSGAVAALIVSRVLRSFLFGVGVTDPMTFAGVAILFAGVALLACWVPMRRAAKIDPIEALRYD